MTNKMKKEKCCDIKTALENGVPVYYGNLRIVEVAGKNVRTENDTRFFTPWLCAVYFEKSFNEIWSKENKN